MAGFDNRTLQTMQKNRNQHENHLNKIEEFRSRQAETQKRIGLRAVTNDIEARYSRDKQVAYDSATTNILELAHAGTDSHSLEREDIQDAASILLEEPSANYLEKNVARIYTSLPDYVDTIDMNTANSKFMSSEEYTQLKLKRVAFNATLKEVIDTDPRITPEELQTYINDAALTYGYDNETVSVLNEDVITRLGGMRHELAFESVIFRLKYDVEETTFADDLDGVDCRVRRDDNTLIDIDVKSSPTNASMSKEKRERMYQERFGMSVPATKLTLWSGFKRDDFLQSSPWRPTEAAIARVIPQVEAAIDAVPTS